MLRAGDREPDDASLAALAPWRASRSSASTPASRHAAIKKTESAPTVARCTASLSSRSASNTSAPSARRSAARFDPRRRSESAHPISRASERRCLPAYRLHPQRNRRCWHFVPLRSPYCLRPNAQRASPGQGLESTARALRDIHHLSHVVLIQNMRRLPLREERPRRRAFTVGTRHSLSPAAPCLRVRHAGARVGQRTNRPSLSHALRVVAVALRR